MPELDPLGVFTTRLEGIGLTYMVTGSVASIVYGEPRLTHDVDLVVALASDDVDALISAFPIDDFHCPPEEVIRVEMNRRRRGHFNLIHHATGFKADIYLAGDDELHKWALAKRKQMDLEGQSLWLAPIEYVILRKMEYYIDGKSEKHIQDIQSMLDISADEIDLAFIEKESHRLGLSSTWSKFSQQPH